MKPGKRLERRTPLVTRTPLSGGKPLERKTPLAPGKPLERRTELKAKPPTCPSCGGGLPMDGGRVCTCGSSVEAWGLRTSTLSAKGSGLGAATGLPKVTDFPESERAKVRRRSGGGCEVAGCTNTATDMHHRRKRSVGPHTAVNALHACPFCHVPQVHGRPEWAIKNGYMVPTSEDPATAPMLTDFGWVLLAEDGTYERTSAPETVGVG